MRFDLVDYKCRSGEKWADVFTDECWKHAIKHYRFALDIDKWDLVKKRVFNPINDLCNGLLDLSDIDIFGANDAVRILEYIESQEGRDDDEDVKDIFYMLKFFCKKAIEHDCHLLIEC